MYVREENHVSQTYQNVMELLVTEEIEEKLKAFSPRLSEEFNQSELSAYALNRLPPLYATSKEGLEQQKELCQKEFKNLISATVDEAFEVVQKNPLRFSTPLAKVEETEFLEARIALQELADWLSSSSKKVSLRDLIKAMKVVKQVLS